MKGRQTASRRELLTVAALIFAWLAATAWARPLALPDEGRYDSVAWEMLRSGDWLTPTLDGMPFFHKPPLFYWITAAALKVFGLNEWAGRAAPLVGASVGAFAVYAFLRRWQGERMARLATLALLVQPMFFLGAQYANLDMLVAGCITATVVLLADAALCLDGGLPYRRALLGAYAMAAVGMLAKGLIGFVIPAMIIGLWLILRRRWKALWGVISVPGLLVFLVVGMPWFFAMESRFPDFLHYFFVVQHFQRFSQAGFNNVLPVWFYPAALALLSLPWLPWLARMFGRQVLADPERGAIRWLMLVWMVCVVGFFSMPKSKLIGYVLPAIPPLAYFMADAYVSRVRPGPRTLRWWQLSMALSLVLGLGAVIGFSVHPLKSSRAFAAALNARRSPGQPIIMLYQYAYDVPFYARLQEPVTIVDDWRSPEVQLSDNWRKEIADAREFGPAPGPAEVLVVPADLPAALCSKPVSWVMGDTSRRQAWPALGLAEAVVTVRDTTLWRVDLSAPGLATALGCPGTPSAGSAGK